MPRGGPTAGEGPPGMRTTGPGAVSAFNPVYAVELGPEETPEGQRWSPAEAARFLAATAADPLGLMFRLVVLRGFRRGEAVARGPITPSRRSGGGSAAVSWAASPAVRRNIQANRGATRALNFN